MSRRETVEIRVRYAECDPMGVAHHSAYPIWLEIGRTELLRSSGVSYRALEEKGILLAVVLLSIRYRKPAKYDDVLTLHTEHAQTTHAKIEHVYELKRGDELLMSAATTLACMDRQGHVRRMPEWLVVVPH